MMLLRLLSNDTTQRCLWFRFVQRYALDAVNVVLWLRRLKLGVITALAVRRHR
jgi:hypothetical protein